MSTHSHLSKQERNKIFLKRLSNQPAEDSLKCAYDAFVKLFEQVEFEFCHEQSDRMYPPSEEIEGFYAARWFNEEKTVRVYMHKRHTTLIAINGAIALCHVQEDRKRPGKLTYSKPGKNGLSITDLINL